MFVDSSQTIARLVNALLTDPCVGRGVYEISRDGNTLTLSGMVVQERDRQAVEQLARRQIGIHSIVNTLQTQPPASALTPSA